MTRSRSLRLAAALGMALPLGAGTHALGGTPAAAAPVQPSTSAASGGVAHFVAEVTVDHAVVDEESRVVEKQPTVRYRLTLRQGTRGPTTEMQFLDTPPFPGRGPLADPTAGFRIVLGEDGFQVFDPAGRAVGAPAPAQVELTRQAHQLVVPRVDASRGADLRRRLGAPKGRLRRLERFVREHDAEMEEVLVDPALALPMEINVTKGGQLARRTTFRYGSLPDGRIFRAVQVDESVLPGAEGPPRRLRTTTTYVPAGGGR